MGPPDLDPADAPDAEKEPTDPADPLRLNGIVPLSTIPRERIDWAWPGRFAFGKHSDVSGDPGDGKSLVLTTLAAQITRGLPLPYGSTQVREPKAVLYLSTEDDAADTIRPRVEAAGGDPSLVYVQDDTHHLILPGSAEALEGIIRRLGAEMVVIDPLFSYVGDLETNSFTAAVAVCDRLKRIAAATHCILVTIRHLNKAIGAAARYRAGGSIGWQAKPRVALSLGRDPNDREVRVLAPIKGNVGREPQAATFRVGEVVQDGEAVARVLWGDERAISADEMMGAEVAGAKKVTRAEALAQEIRDRLREAGDDGLPLSDLRGKLAGSTFYSARKILDGEIAEVRDSDDPRAPLRWRLRDL